MIDYNKIEKLFPKSFGKLLSWLFKGESGRFRVLHTGELIIYERMGTPDKFNDRDLFNFFDGAEVGVYVKNWTQRPGWFEVEVCKMPFSLFGEAEYLVSPTRSEAETAGFIKAFEILESKL